jgi:hypothetical protein
MTLGFVCGLLFGLLVGWLAGRAYQMTRQVVVHWVHFQGADRLARINVTHDAERN